MFKKREIEGKEGEKFGRMENYLFGYNKKIGKRFGGEWFEGKTWINFVKNTISFILCLDSKLGEKKRNGRGGIRRESSSYLFRREGKEKGRKISVFLSNLFHLRKDYILNKTYLCFLFKPLPFKSLVSCYVI